MPVEQVGFLSRVPIQWGCIHDGIESAVIRTSANNVAEYGSVIIEAHINTKPSPSLRGECVLREDRRRRRLGPRS